MAKRSAATHYRTCPLCEAMCGLAIQTGGRRVLSIKGDREDPFSRGHLCPKAAALADVQEDPDRLREPMLRQGKDWSTIPWETAYELVTDRLAEIYRRHGPDAIGIYYGNPNVHNHGMLTHGGRFMGLFKTKNRFSASSVDQWPHQLVAYHLYGHQLLVPIPDIDHTDFFLMLGANPLASNGSLMTVPDVRRRLKALRQRGGQLVVIDPRRTETAAVADHHHFIRPGTDAALLAAMMQIILTENLSGPGRLQKFVAGWDGIAPALRTFTPESAARVTGMEAGVIRRLARTFAASPRAVCYGRMGVSTQPFGALCQWLIQLINIATGNLDRVGGALFTKPAVDLIDGPKSRPGHFGKWRSRVRGLPEFAGELPAAALAEEILTEGKGQIRALITAAGNPVLSTPNGRRLESALPGLDFMVSVDFYRNETTRFADVILPPTAPLEHDHYDLIFHTFAVRNTVKFSEPVLPKPTGAKHDWEIFTELGEAMAAKLGMAMKPFLTPAQFLDMGLKAGPYGERTNPARALTLDKVKAAPHGIDLGPLEPCLPQRLHTPDQRIHCATGPYLADLARLERELFSREPAELLLIGRRHLRSNNSWMHNYHRLVKGKPRCVLLMNPADLAARNLNDGQEVRLQSRTGSVLVGVAASHEMMPGVVSLPHGWGHHRPDTRLSVAGSYAGVSLNDVTDETHLDPVSGNAAVNGVPVVVEGLDPER